MMSQNYLHLSEIGKIFVSQQQGKKPSKNLYYFKT